MLISAFLRSGGRSRRPSHGHMVCRGAFFLVAFVMYAWTVSPLLVIVPAAYLIVPAVVAMARHMICKIRIAQSTPGW